MDKIPLQFATSSVETRHKHEGAARLVNCYVEPTPNAEASYVVYAIDGWDAFATMATSGGVRALHDIGSKLLAVIGRQVVSIDASGAVTLLGGIASDGLVTIASNKRSPSPQHVICCDGLCYMVQGGSYTQVTDPDLSAATSVVELDGYVIYFDRSGKIIASDLNSANVIDGLSFATAEASADDGVRVSRRGQELVFFGAKTTEFWANNGGDPFPFARSTVRHYGCLAAGSAANVGETLGFINHVGHVCLINGYSADRISTPTVERAIADEPDKEGIRGFTFVERGHEMYALTGTNWTHVYDVNTGEWHERRSYGRDRWRAACSASFGGTTMFGAYDVATVFKSDPEIDDEDGNPIELIAQPRPVTVFPFALVWDRVDVRAIPGVGKNTTAQAEYNPQIMLDYSDDGGQTWSVQRMLPVGVQGQKLRECFATRLGKAPRSGRTLRLSMTASVTRGIVGAYLTTRKGA